MQEEYNKLLEVFVDTAITLRTPMSICFGDFIVNVNPDNERLKWSASGLKSFNFTSRPGLSEFSEALYSILWTLS